MFDEDGECAPVYRLGHINDEVFCGLAYPNLLYIGRVLPIVAPLEVLVQAQCAFSDLPVIVFLLLHIDGLISIRLDD